jgi:hypothetical protein
MHYTYRGIAIYNFSFALENRYDLENLSRDSGIARRLYRNYDVYRAVPLSVLETPDPRSAVPLCTKALVRARGRGPLRLGIFRKWFKRENASLRRRSV